MRYLLAFFFFSIFGVNHAGAYACRDTRTMGADYYQAKANCEAVLQGEAYDCKPGGRNLWYCSCQIGCRGPGGPGRGRFTRTLGADYYQARGNCEVVLNGDAENCRPGGRNLWYCDCYY